eukprot:c7176_g1_i2.p1 GENE.c7176_g1_i2~~c7176_g1_i2.p1  ORF type:complete len:196 (-),score=26.08 c7176_g1_i2:43-597(-)
MDTLTLPMEFNAFLENSLSNLQILNQRVTNLEYKLANHLATASFSSISTISSVSSISAIFPSAMATSTKSIPLSPPLQTHRQSPKRATPSPTTPPSQPTLSESPKQFTAPKQAKRPVPDQSPIEDYVVTSVIFPSFPLDSVSPHSLDDLQTHTTKHVFEFTEMESQIPKRPRVAGDDWIDEMLN